MLSRHSGTGPVSIVIASVFGILFGIISAIRRNSILDQIVRAISVTGVSIPAFWFALLMLYFFYYKLKYSRDRAV